MESIATIIGLIICFIAIIICLVFMFRNQKIYEYRKKALDIVSEYTRIAIKKHYFEEWGYFHDLYESYPSYDKMLLDLKRWKFEHFYGDLEDQCKSYLEKLENQEKKGEQNGVQ